MQGKSLIIKKPAPWNRFLFFIIYLIVFFPSFTQSSVLVGSVKDKQHKTPIPYAYIILNDTAHTITNEKGIFTAPISNEALSEVSLKIQMLGYETVNINITYPPLEDTIKIVLTETPMQLQEVVVSDQKKRAFKANEIVKIAIDSLYRRQETGGIHPHKNMYGHYNQIHYSQAQETDTSFSKKYSRPVPGNLRNYHFLIQGYLKLDSKQNVKILRLRRSYDSRNYKHAYYSGKGNGFSSELKSVSEEGEREKAIAREKELYQLRGFFNIDPIAHFQNEVDEVRALYLASGSYGYLNDEFVKRHTFKNEGVFEYENEKVVKIKILPSPKSYKHGYFSKHQWVPVGYLYIRLKDFGILRMEYAYLVNPKKKNFASWAFITSRGSPFLFKYLIAYKEVDGHLRLAYLHRFQKDIDVTISEESESDKVTFHYVEREFYTTRFDHQETSKPPFNTNMDTPLLSLYDNYTYDDFFWENLTLKMIDSEKYEKLIQDLETDSGVRLEDQFKSGK